MIRPLSGAFFYCKEREDMIRLENVSKTFQTKERNVHAVKNVNLNIHEHEIFGLIGFSGAGKSTLIRCINLLERPTSGKVWIGNTELTALSEKELRNIRKKIGMIFQHFNLMKSRTVFENVAFGLKGSGLSKDQVNKKVLGLLEMVELKERAGSYPSQLSGGQKQRVAIARALANDPNVLLCDEATSALDPQTTQSILKLLKKVNQELGITIVLITHEMGVIKEICDRVGVMENGEVKELGEVAEVFANPKEEITKSFIATTSNISKIYELIEENADIAELKESEQMVLLSYGSENANQALISKISRENQVDANIIFGNVEVLQNKSIGHLVVTISGEHENVKLALENLKRAGVGVEVIKKC